MSKVNLADAYMRIWVILEYVLAVDFLIPKEKDSDPLLASLHLSIPMGYVYSTPLSFYGNQNSQ